MPWKRVGRSVFKVLAGGKLKKVGTSDSVEKAKAYLKKLYMVENEGKKT